MMHLKHTTHNASNEDYFLIKPNGASGVLHSVLFATDNWISLSHNNFYQFFFKKKVIKKKAMIFQHNRKYLANYVDLNIFILQ